MRRAPGVGGGVPADLAPEIPAARDDISYKKYAR